MLSIYKYEISCLAQFSYLIFRYENKQGLYVFDMPSVANDMGVTVGEISNQLHNLKVWLIGKFMFLRIHMSS